MFEGELVAIYTGDRKHAEPRSVDEIQLIAGRGLLGDRYFQEPGAGEPGKEVTLIEVEALAGLRREYDLTLEAARTRRNLLTSGVPLNHLVNREFSVGPVVLRGVRLCEPCAHLEGMTIAGIKKGLTHRGGLRAQVVAGGTIRKGDAIRPREEAKA